MTPLFIFIFSSIREQYSKIDIYHKKALGASYAQEGHAPVMEMQHWINISKKIQTNHICEIGFNAGHSASA